MGEPNQNRTPRVAGEEGGSQRTSAQPRQPSNLQGLLRFAIEAANHDEPFDVQRQRLHMDPERRAHLENAIADMTRNISREVEDNIKLLSDKDVISKIYVDTEVPPQIINAFATLDEHVTVMDMAIGFFKVGGVAIFPVCLSCENLTVRTSACLLIATLCQNNPYCQEKILECGYLHTLISMFDAEQDGELLYSLMYAISCIIRHHEPCVSTFINDGLHILNKALRTSNTSTKAAFLLSSIFPEHNHIADKLVSNGTIEALVSALPRQRSERSEQVLCAMHTLLSESGPIYDEMKKSGSTLEQTLIDYLNCEELKFDTDYIEEKEYCEFLLTVLFDKSSPSRSRPAEQTELSVDR